ncbi:MAG TPA: hypothetical protein DC024_07700 [Clostridiales bacterium]|jgi:hypothetical protein|nr:hypothetical protein [Clostridiales bacterium]HCS09864.1 hypothetical protein [Clostridiales bacterium]
MNKKNGFFGGLFRAKSNSCCNMEIVEETPKNKKGCCNMEIIEEPEDCCCDTDAEESSKDEE